MAREKEDVFPQEQQTLLYAQDIAQKDDLSLAQFQQEYQALTRNYEKLLNDAKVITNISDRLQNRLNLSNEKLNFANENIQANAKVIEEKNNQLRTTIEELIQTKISKKASTIVLFAAILLFIISELFLDPIVEKYVGKNFWLGMMLKGSIALMLRPIDYLVEWYLMRDMHKKAKNIVKTPKE